MCEILIKLSQRNDPDPEIDQRCWKTGMPVVVMDDGHPWGREERPPQFFVLKIPGVPKEKALKFIEEYIEDTGLYDPDGQPIMKMTARRLWKLNYDNVPNALKTAATQKGEIVIGKDVTWTTLKNYLRNLKTGEAAGDFA